MTTTVTIYKNNDGSLPASHLVEIQFSGEIGQSPIQRVPALVLKQTEQARGQPLTGAAVPVTNELFWIALSDDQEQVSRLFAWGGPVKFEKTPLVEGATGVPLVAGAVAHLECRVVAAHAAGDHTIYVGEVLATAIHPGRPLLYHRGRYQKLAGDGGDLA